MIPNAALIQGAVTAMEKYTTQPDFFVITLLVSTVSEKKGVKFLGDDLVNKEIKILVSGGLQKKLQLKRSSIITGEIKKANPFLWRAVEDTFKLQVPVKKAVKKTSKK